MIFDINGEDYYANEKTVNYDVTKDENQQLASRRVKVENVLAHIKILRIVKERNRNYKLGFRATIIRIACALHNFRNAEKIVQKKEKICGKPTLFRVSKYFLLYLNIFIGYQSS